MLAIHGGEPVLKKNMPAWPQVTDIDREMLKNTLLSGNYNSGNPELLRMDYLPSSSIIRNNDPVVTSGSTVYPRDLVVGYVIDADFDDTGVAKYALLDPAANVETIEQVFILTNYNAG